MSNEDLVTLIQAGERDRLPELWRQVERFVIMQAIKMDNKLNGWHGVTFDDFYQSGYIAFSEAVETFSATGGASFIGWLDFYLRREFAKWGGWQTEHQKNDPLNNAVSLDAPIGDSEEDDTTLGDRQSDPGSVQAFENAERAIWNAQLQCALEAAIDQIPLVQGETIRLRYFKCESLSQVALVQGISTERVRQIEEKALKSLRDTAAADQLEAFLDKWTPYHLHVGVQQFHRTQTSAVEKIVLIRERLRQRLELDL